MGEIPYTILPMKEMMPIPISPCTGYCVYDYENDYCLGCGRTLDEISRTMPSAPADSIKEEAQHAQEKDS